MPTIGKFGRLAAVPDPRTVRLRDYLAPGAVPAPPASSAWDHGITAWGMAGNGPDPQAATGVPRAGCGDCTCAAIKHALQAVTANARGTAASIPDPAVIALYRAVSGYNPATGANDVGATLLSVLKVVQANGLAGHQLAAYGTCSLACQADVAACIDLFGGCYVAFRVPQSVVDQFGAGQAWDVVPGSPLTGEGHAVMAVDYDADGLTVVTWGVLQRMTWRFFHTFVDEAYGLVFDDWIAASGTAPSGFNLAQLLADVQQLQQPPAPALISTTTSLSLNPSPATAGQPTQASVTVTAADGSVPSGIVTISAPGQVTLGPTLDAQGQASQPLTFSTPGTVTVSASYPGDATHAPSAAAPVNLVVQAPADPLDPLYRWLRDVGVYEVTARDKAELAVIVQTILRFDPAAGGGV